jgi:hypothetical protein
MASHDAVGRLYPESFGSFVVASARVSVATTGNAVVVIPILSGGLTNSGNTATSGSVILRRITAQNPNSDISAANIAISISSTGNMAAANAVVANVVLSNLSAVGRYQDLTTAGAFGANTTVSGNSTSALFVNVNTAVTGGSFDIKVHGDVVSA